MTKLVLEAISECQKKCADCAVEVVMDIASITLQELDVTLLGIAFDKKVPQMPTFCVPIGEE